LNPDRIREVVLKGFPRLTDGPRSDGWSFFLGTKIPPPKSNRIFRVRRSGNGSTILRVVTTRLENRQVWEDVEGDLEALNRLVNEEIRLFEDHFLGE
jgi:hypothetical protein